MTTRFSDDPLRERLRALHVPPPSAALRGRILAAADARLPEARAAAFPLRSWRIALAACAVLAVCAFATNEYLAWKEVQELAELDTLSTATLLLL